MLVMKFGGASVKDAANVRNVAQIISAHTDFPLLVVISAMDKTTNELELLADYAEKGHKAEIETQFQKIKHFHSNIIQNLFSEEDCKKAEEHLAPYWEELWQIVQGILFLKEFPPLTYDRVVAFGELVSTKIVSLYFATQNQDCRFLDARSIIKTDLHYGQAKVIWSLTNENVQKLVKPLLQSQRIVITQGFIASAISGKTTTLGREGSDYTAAIFSYCLDAEKMIVWKDVPGILNADPRIHENPVQIMKLSYQQAVQMTFYGATVIHPKTIQPLYHKHIPLYVRSFKDMNALGTCISAEEDTEKTPTYLRKSKQVLIKITPKDFSFIDEILLQEVFQHANHTGLKINLSQTTAIYLWLCADSQENSLKKFEASLLDKFVFEIQKDLTLFAVLNYKETDLALTKEANVMQIVEDKLLWVK
ncbi:MAG: aspartate kinase [Bacteroidia bacterium]